MEIQPTTVDEPQVLDSTQRKKAKVKQAYCNRVDILSDKSVTGIHFHPDTDIDWDNPEYKIIDDDERWILGPSISLGAHKWYQSQPREEQIRIGKHYMANTVLVGAQFEKLLNIGIMADNLGKSVYSPDAKYPLHEAGEEMNHIIMFQEFVRRTGVESKGAPAWFRRIVPLLAATVPDKLPIAFWAFVYAGEEPIDQMQKSILKHGDEVHPLLENIMKIHIQEEARHISYAKLYLEQSVNSGVEDKDQSRTQKIQKKVLAIVYPVMMRLGSDVIMRPSKEVREDMGIPDDVAKEIWWNSENGKESLYNLFPDARKFAHKLGIREGKLVNFVWKRLGLDYGSKPDTQLEQLVN